VNVTVSTIDSLPAVIDREVSDDFYLRIRVPGYRSWRYWAGTNYGFLTLRDIKHGKLARWSGTEESARIIASTFGGMVQVTVGDDIIDVDISIDSAERVDR
jgi:hypothetical protein